MRAVEKHSLLQLSQCMQLKDDEELGGALDSLDVSLKENIQLLSSFEKYKKEVLGDSLDWTPMHTSQQVRHHTRHLNKLHHGVDRCRSSAMLLLLQAQDLTRLQLPM